MDARVIFYKSKKSPRGIGGSFLRAVRGWGALVNCIQQRWTEELGHVEMVSTLLYQLTRNLTEEQIKEGGFDKYFVDHTTGVFPAAAAGTPFSTTAIGVKGDVLADLHEDLAAEQKARVTYDNLLRLIDDPDVKEPIKFLREREVVHYQRFCDALRVAQDHLDSKNFYAYNPSFDKCKRK